MIFTDLISLLRQSGLSKAELDTLVVCHPAGAFAVRVRRAGWDRPSTPIENGDGPRLSPAWSVGRPSETVRFTREAPDLARDSTY